MNDLNQVQKALEEKARNEVKQIIENFIKEVNKMEEKYGGKNMFHIGYEQEIYCDIGKFEGVITQTLTDRHLEDIVRYKAKELLNKLELI